MRSSVHRSKAFQLLCALVVSVSLLSEWELTNAAHRHKFPKCKDVRFCRTQLSRDENGNPNTERMGIRWNVRPGTVQLSSERSVLSMTLDVTGLRESDVPCVNGAELEISRVLGGDIVRVHMTDALPLKPRHLVQDVLTDQSRQGLTNGIDVDSSTLSSFSSNSGSPSTMKFQWNQQWSVTVTNRPFSLQIFDQLSDTSILSLNSRNLLHFECAVAAKHDDQPSEWWSESFSGHTYEHWRGPNAIGADIRFDESRHVYGLAEHATGFVLSDTTGRSGDKAESGVLCENLGVWCDDKIARRSGSELSILRSDSRSQPYRLYNLDVFEYELEITDSLYGAIPLITALPSNGKSDAVVSILWLNAAETFIDVDYYSSSESVSTHWMSETGQMELFIMLGRQPSTVVRQYIELTGKPQLPPLFSLGHHQCRWNYISNTDTLSISDRLSDWDVPTDVLWLDIEHTDGKRYFTWDKQNFDNAQSELINPLWEQSNRRLVTIVDPHIKKDHSYYIYKGISSENLWVKDKDGADYTGWCWPGDSGYPDFVNPKMREWWAKQFALENYDQSTLSVYTWNDMNEPSVFNGPQVSMPKSCQHFSKGNGQYSWLHEDLHNMYGYYFHSATFDGHLYRSGGQQRPFVLSRAFFAGTQKYGAIWTGDNTATWGHLRYSVPMLLSLGVSGLPFVGADIGGFFKDPNGELMMRWYELASFTPFFRNHAHEATKRRELWEFDDEYSIRMKSAILQRYRILPYIYTVYATETYRFGDPLLRPIWFDSYNHSSVFDRAMLDNDEAFMVGSALLIQGIYQSGQDSVSVQLPPNQLWFDRSTNHDVINEQNFVNYYLINGNDDSSNGKITLDGFQNGGIPVFQKGGSIVAEKHRVRRSSENMRFDPYTLVVALNQTGQATGVIYNDDGYSNNHLGSDGRNNGMNDAKAIQSEEYFESRLSYDNGLFQNVVIKDDFHFHSKSSEMINELIIFSNRPLYGSNEIELFARNMGDSQWIKCDTRVNIRGKHIENDQRNLLRLRIPDQCGDSLSLSIRNNFELKIKV